MPIGCFTWVFCHEGKKQIVGRFYLIEFWNRDEFFANQNKELSNVKDHPFLDRQNFPKN